ncbi:MAG: FdtA/QdtA family cupin domain-containing protein [Bacteroidales bacterium]|nr:FdtA/QdtA family cupin domain-containing protein [Bacteroidales bacterium]
MDINDTSNIEQISPKVELINLEKHGDERGSLIALEPDINVPFDIKRVYYIFDTKSGVDRGFHAHKKLKQLLICTSGSVDIDVEYGTTKQTYHLDNSSQGLLIEGLVWRVMKNFKENTVLMVLASEKYSEQDYIRNYDKFKEMNK